MNAEQLAERFLDVSPWKGRGWSDLALDNMFQHRAHDCLLLRVSFSGTEVQISAGELGAHQYFPALLDFFRMVQEYFPIQGNILVSLLDGAPGDISSSVPILSFSKPASDENPLLIPDPYYLSNFGYRDNFATIDRLLAEIPRAQRLPVAYWRGSSTGVPTITGDTWRENPRVKLCLLAKHFPELLSAKITRVVQAGANSVANELDFQSISAEWEPMTNNLLYRYGIDIDGNCCAWGFFQKMYMDLAILKVKSDWMQWYYPLLEDGVHIISVDASLENLQESLLRLRADEALGDRIAANAHDLARELDYAQAVIYTGCLLSRVFEWKTAG